MRKLPKITGRRVIATLRKTGFEITRIKGSHHFLKHPDGRCTLGHAHFPAEKRS